MLAHAEIIVRAPDHDLANTAIPLMQAGQRKAPGLAFEIGKESIASFGFELSDVSAEKRIEIHAALPEKAEPQVSFANISCGAAAHRRSLKNRKLYAALRP